MCWTWLLLAAVGLMLSAEPPRQKEDGEKRKGADDGYVKVEIKAELVVSEEIISDRPGDTAPKKRLFAELIAPGPALVALGPAKGPPGPSFPGFPGRVPGITWRLSLDGRKDLQQLVRKLKGKKVILRGEAVPHAGMPGSLWFEVEVSSLELAADKK